MEVVGRVDPGCLVFVDDMSTHTSVAPLYSLRARRRASIRRDPEKPR
jgi:hypothetical protein